MSGRSMESQSLTGDSTSNELERELEATLARLERATRSGDAIPSSSSRENLQATSHRSIDTLIAGLCSSRGQQEAIEALQRFIDPRKSKTSPARVIRIAEWRRGKIRRIYETSLGWLTAGSTAFEEAVSLWESKQGDSTVTLIECEPNTLGLTVDSGEDQATTRWLNQYRVSIGNVIGSRPKYPFVETGVTRILELRRHLTTGFVILALALLWPASYRVSCDAVVETTQQRVISAPYQGKLAEVLVHPGDKVEAGQTIARLDEEALTIELEALSAESGKAAKEYDAALGTGDIAAAQKARLLMKQSQRNRDLVESRLRDLEILSPIDGVVVGGDLRQHVGNVLTTGQALMEIAPLQSLDVELQFEGADVGFVDDDSRAKIFLPSVGQSSTVSIRELHPAATTRQDRRVFIARTEVPSEFSGDLTSSIRPGMRGKAVIYGPKRPWVWSYIRSYWLKTRWWLEFWD
ncbi:MAG: efflux RND transporter periplasmic adaptor subunit [Planctomycetota bacterium]